ncbi:MAG: type VI secretion system tube protein Hcp [Gammaproteobacteria bacterium]|nr:type VI secretion system tube protein Hcp [Gammaproteobacteria bacterium]
MALNIYIQFTFNGSPIAGEPRLLSLGDVDVSEHVEAVAFYQELSMQTGRGSGILTGNLVTNPLTIVKVPDRTTPMFLHALANAHSVNATIKFFKVSRQGGPLLQQVTTTTNGRISAFRSEMLNSLFSESAATPMLERISFTYQTLHTENVITGTESEILWQSMA